MLGIAIKARTDNGLYCTATANKQQSMRNAPKPIREGRSIPWVGV
jgi:hypothetical protein